MIREVLVEYQDLLYKCVETKRGWKCGQCLFGLINPFGSYEYQDLKCKRCGASLFETKYGLSWLTLKVYKP